ncbi:hypothetical protein C8D87_11868 [Lentzea atacamensis]|uniref:Uncharacterized protein n=1 Tax=Lentzea atacamensis TaxID=531938 RepID=A0ABX9DVG5_9PSEU|nr:hypothetical protein C8D87_11868 [Lentzea atacamensis]
MLGGRALRPPERKLKAPIGGRIKSAGWDDPGDGSNPFDDLRMTQGWHCSRLPAMQFGEVKSGADRVTSWVERVACYGASRSFLLRFEFCVLL